MILRGHLVGWLLGGHEPILASAVSVDARKTGGLRLFLPLPLTSFN